MTADGLPAGYDAWRTWHPDEDAVDPCDECQCDDPDDPDMECECGCHAEYEPDEPDDYDDGGRAEAAYERWVYAGRDR